MKLLALERQKRGNEIVKSMNSNFAKETNQRDEDAEMQKFIDEQLRFKREAEKQKQQQQNSESGLENSSNGTSLDNNNQIKKYKTPEDALFDLPKYLTSSTTKNKSEETLSEQMLSGIPEVDLGVEERIKNIEETEKAKQRLLSTKTQPTTNHSSHLINGSTASHLKARTSNHHENYDTKEPVVGDAPKHELLTVQTNKRKLDHKEKGPNNHQHKHHNNNNNHKSGKGVEKATDDAALEKFKKNMRHSKSSRIKIA
jgi:hypothetical protein